MHISLFTQQYVLPESNVRLLLQVEHIAWWFDLKKEELGKAQERVVGLQNQSQSIHHSS